MVDDNLEGKPWGTTSPGETDPLPSVDFADIKPVLTDDTIIEGLLTAGTMSVLYGDAGTRKTFFALDLSLHVATGHPWRGRQVRPGFVLYVATEGFSGVTNRVAAFRQFYANHGPVPFSLALAQVDLRDSCLDSDRIIAAIEEKAKQFGFPPVLVVIDTLSRALAGGSDAEAVDMAAFIRNVDRIRLETRAHVLIIHHTGKDRARGARGHSSLRAAVDTEIEISADSGSAFSVARVTKQRDLTSVGDEFEFSLERVEIGKVEGRGPVYSCVVTEPSFSTKRTHHSRPLPAKAKRALDLLKQLIEQSPLPIPEGAKVPAGITTGASKSAWRDLCKAERLIAKNQEDGQKQKGNPREEHKRLVIDLKNAGLVDEQEDFVWLMPGKDVT